MVNKFHDGDVALTIDIFEIFFFFEKNHFYFIHIWITDNFILQYFNFHANRKKDRKIVLPFF